MRHDDLRRQQQHITTVNKFFLPVLWLYSCFRSRLSLGMAPGGRPYWVGAPAVLIPSALMFARPHALVARLARVGVGAFTAADDEIAVGNSDLSTPTEAQAASLAETVGALDPSSGTVRQNASDAREAQQLVPVASSVAVKGARWCRK